MSAALLVSLSVIHLAVTALASGRHLQLVIEMHRRRLDVDALATVLVKQLQTQNRERAVRLLSIVPRAWAAAFALQLLSLELPRNEFKSTEGYREAAATERFSERMAIATTEIVDASRKQIRTAYRRTRGWGLLALALALPGTLNDSVELMFIGAIVFNGLAMAIVPSMRNALRVPVVLQAALAPLLPPTDDWSDQDRAAARNARAVLQTPSPLPRITTRTET